ncbi:MAG: DUF839 domain-containing protein [Deltaproteobacteria bacterium]|nr:DUF839 domain-containing protein [Deltaproteobacteria bacterium]
MTTVARHSDDDTRPRSRAEPLAAIIERRTLLAAGLGAMAALAGCSGPQRSARPTPTKRRSRAGSGRAGAPFPFDFDEVAAGADDKLHVPKGYRATVVLADGAPGLTPADGFPDAASVLIDARRAADAVGATPMDRPEDVEPQPGTGVVHVALTNHAKREKTEPVHPRAHNHFGHILTLRLDPAPRRRRARLELPPPRDALPGFRPEAASPRRGRRHRAGGRRPHRRAVGPDALTYARRAPPRISCRSPAPARSCRSR